MKKRSKRHAAPGRPRAIQTSRHLQVAHVKHTGRVTPRRTTSYPSLVMIVLCVGVFLLSWTRFVTADPPLTDPVTHSYTVHASVPGPPPTQAPTIDDPTDGQVFTDLPITVSGSCEVNTYEVLYRNNVFSGVALCSATGSYSLQTGLFVGANQLQARVFSPTDVPGPFSTTVNVTYKPPTPPPTTGGGGTTSPAPSGGGRSHTTTGSTGVSAPEPLIFKDDFQYQGYYTGQIVTWRPNIEGGTTPYAISVDWGDGTHSLYSRTSAGAFDLNHTYKHAGGYKGSYVVKLTASDANGEQAFLQLLIIINNPPAGAGGTTGHLPGQFTGLGSTTGIMSELSKLIWPGYGVVLLMLFSFWLGERRELSFVRAQTKKPAQRRTRR